jgi:PAS domain S-box-containing protein
MSDENKNSILFDSDTDAAGDVRLNLLYEIGRILSSLETMNEAAPQILEAICRHLDFELGELWCLGKGKTTLNLESVWHFPSSAYEEFVARSYRFNFSIGEGMPGKVWEKNEPVWIENINFAENLPRKVFIEEIGMQSAFAFPIMLGEKFIGAFSFFSRRRRQPDKTLLQMFAAVGNNIGQFVKREHVESNLRDSEIRYRAFIEQSTEGIWRFELDENFSVELPVDEQVKLAFERGYLAECNDAMARMYGLEKAEDLVGSRIADLLDMTDEANVEYIRSFIESDYNLIDAESHERDVDGNDKYFLNSLVGTIENGCLIRVWGTQRDITWQKKAERARRESEESYRIVAETASDAIIKIDENSKILFVNSAVKRIFGFTVEEMLGQSLTMIMPENLRERHRAGFRRYLETGVRHLHWEGLEISALHKNGQTFPLEISFGEYNQNGNQFFIGIARDISERKKADVQLLESQAMLSLTMRSSRMGAWSRDVTTDEVWWSEELEEIFGLPPGGFARTRNGFHDLIHPEDKHLVAAEVDRAITEKRDYIVEFRFLHADGSVRWMEGRGQAFYSDAGKPIRMYGIGIDITERKLAEEALRASENQLRVLTNAMPALISYIDSEYRYRFVNQTYTDWFGHAAEEVVGKTIFEVLGEEAFHTLRPHVEAALAGKEEIFETEIPYKHGGARFIRAIYTPDISDGTVKGFFVLVLDITDSKRAEEALRESEANFRQLAEAVPQFVWVTETDGSLSYVNEQWLEFSGLTFEQTNDPQLIADVFHPGDVERLAMEWEKAFATGKVLEIELRMRNRQGEYRWFLTRSRPVKDESGKILKWFGTSTDITEGKQAENRLALLAEISDLTRTLEKPEELLFAVSQAVGEHLEIKRCLFNEIDLENDREIVHRDYCRGVPSVAGIHRISDYSSVTSADMIAGKTVVNCDSKIDERTAGDYAKIYEPNGERAYITVPLLRENRWVASLWVSDDKPRNWSRQEISLLETIAERTWTAIEKMRIDSALRESRERFSKAFNASPLVLTISSLTTGELIEVNETFVNATGYTRAEAIGKTTLELGLWTKPPEREAEMETVRSVGHLSNAEYTFRTKSGAEIIGLLSAERIEIGGEPFALTVIQDITERKLAEAERERLLKSEQQARETAEEANRAKDEFIALVSHELRSPLNAMLGWTRILQDQKPDAKMIEYALDVIIRNARSQSRLIEDLLDIARIGKGKLRLEMQPTELIPIIKAAVEIIKPSAEASNIKLTEILDRAADFITGDADRLRQVIENLLSNAVKFTPAGGSVSIRLEREKNNARITVSDTGQGISAEFLPQIFERFKQADPSTTRRHGGLGIGLSLARDLVELHGGTISAESEGEGKGTTFTVGLPLRVVAPIKENSDKVENMDSQGKLSGFWILAVDDEADARELVSFMLQINGAKVTTANSAVEALELLKSSNGRLPDVLLSDISMPNESGYALLEKIRALPREHGGQIPAVALTAFNRPEDREAAFEAGFQKHLGKPVEPEDLISAIIETAGRQQQ